VLITARNDGDQNPPFNTSHRLFARSDDGAETWAELWEVSRSILTEIYLCRACCYQT
jgi:hypothetical protein